MLKIIESLIISSCETEILSKKSHLKPKKRLLKAALDI